MHEAIFDIAGRGGYAVATAGTDASLELWCNDHCDLLHVRGSDAPDIVRQVESIVGVREEIRREDEIALITDDCLRRHEEEGVETYLARHDCLLLPPLRYEGGSKFCRTLALDPGSLTACFRDLIDDGADVDVVSKREVDVVSEDAPVLSPESVLPELSGRQHEVLRLAFERGYYEIPRRTTTAQVAAEVGVSRRTAEEHLRRAENKIVAAVVNRLHGRRT
jgi:hypothetical protein